MMDASTTTRKQAMAPTSDERREVAKALLGDQMVTAIPQTRDGFEWMTFHEAAYRFWDMCRRIKSVTKADIANSARSVLADLIDPTCAMEYSGYLPESVKGMLGVYFCSECGSPIYNDVEPSYCPYCGARVVSHDDN